MSSEATAVGRAHPLENRVPPPVLGLLVGGLMAAGAGVGPRLGAFLLVPSVLGALVAAGGWGLVAWGFRTFRAAGTTIDPVAVHRADALVTAGPFARSRNPMYVGFTLMLVGWAIALGSPLALLGPALFAAYLGRFQIPGEERALRARFGDSYLGYVRTVPRWL
jgi:protein-S-isoprenylcysteine O-methyltransferase Ste14